VYANGSPVTPPRTWTIGKNHNAPCPPQRLVFTYIHKDRKKSSPAMEFLSAISSNLTLLIPLSAMFSVQIFKFAREWFRTREPNLIILFGTGGMPSSHSALVTSLATATGLRYGFDGAYFAIATVLALIVMYDARGVRQESGQHARVINRILREIMTGHTISEGELKELLGHTTIEVFVGALVGILYTLVLVLFGVMLTT
jgi:uncharacterized protein